MAVIYINVFLFEKSIVLAVCVCVCVWCSDPSGAVQLKRFSET